MISAWRPSSYPWSAIASFRIGSVSSSPRVWTFTAVAASVRAASFQTGSPFRRWRPTSSSSGQRMSCARKGRCVSTKTLQKRRPCSSEPIWMRSMAMRSSPGHRVYRPIPELIYFPNRPAVSKPRRPGRNEGGFLETDDPKAEYVSERRNTEMKKQGPKPTGNAKKSGRILDRVDSPQDLKKLTPGELSDLAADCRETIIETITRTGGHLASNLGVVELTLALHRAFESPKDRLVWDTSNQCYTHKLVTGRRDRFSSIRTPGGLSGFAEPAESAHDTLAAGHAGTGLSYALGLSLALQDDPGEPYVVAVVGDGALTSGPSYEALNNIVHVKPKRLVVVFNDNGWSISENVGWLVHWRNRFVLHPRYQKLTETGQKLISKFPLGETAWEFARKLKTSVEGLFLPNLIWEEMGLHYIGPVDGHNLREMEEGFKTVKEISREGMPVVLHVLTHKGRGYKLAEENPSKFHQPGTPSPAAGAGAVYTYSQVFARTLTKMMETDRRIVAISAAMLEGTALVEVKKRFPDRVFDVGIAEEHAVIMAAGMAKAGWKPFVAIYSTFLQRSFDQLIHDVCLQSLPVTICIDRAGLVGDDGKTHQGIFDIGYTRVVPNMIVSAPKDENEL